MSFMIGKSVYENTGYKKNYFYLEPGNNVYRVLPPLFSLAPKGIWFKYWGVHKGFVNTEGKYRPLASIEEFDFKSKTIRVHDAVSDKYRENLAKAKAAKDQGMAEEKVKQFMEVYVKPYDTDKKYYVNAVNQQNEIGVLVLPIKLFSQFKVLGKEYEARNIDLTGMKGVFLNFKKIQQFKGDSQTSYSVEIYKEQVQVNGELYEKPKVHEISEDFVVRLQNEAKDLSTLFKIPTSTDLQLLADAQPNERGIAIDRIFGKSETADDDTGPTDDDVDGTLGVTIPNTGGAKAVGAVSLSAGTLGVDLPTMPSPAPAKPATTVQTQDFHRQLTPEVATAKPATNTDFDKMFEQMFGGATK